MSPHQVLLKLRLREASVPQSLGLPSNRGPRRCPLSPLPAPRSPLSSLSAVSPTARPSCLPPAGSQPFRCLYCAATFRFPGALQHHVTTEHFKQSESTFPCELCGELFTSQAQLEGHLESEHPKVMGPETQAATSQVVQVSLGPVDRRLLMCFLRLLKVSPHNTALPPGLSEGPPLPTGKREGKHTLETTLPGDF